MGRERYQRPDDPRGSSGHRTVGAVVVLLVLVIGGILGGLWLWDKANDDSKVGSHDLAQAATASATAATAPSGTHLSTDAFSNLLVLTVDDTSAGNPSLQGAYLLVLDTTASKGTLVTLPTAMSVDAGSGGQTLAQLFSSEGSASCVVPLAEATSVSVSHVVEMDVSSWDTLWGMLKDGASASDLMSQATGLVSSMRTDMDATSLLSYMQEVRGVGRANLSEDDLTSSGGSTANVDATQLGMAVGTLVADE
ncbi:MAG: hypothetical protein PHR15_05260 [Atopobiaceae bacterium]|nr:hypothetical protein [Atopobiaceae bacterium]MCH4180338.1 hypothetical protein [Atopobiaceae bacterium]MCH4214570.1 hypothetical protein [Atopobiaceae bacterium]MCH4229289.1 hypothetical protein [Atopobiaceae bacterium]MCH4276344.1 hypothetical protein [Atopobiaceae bacterium]